MELRQKHCDYQVGYAYVPIQYLEKFYPPEKALEQGTIFPELDIPITEYGIPQFMGGKKYDS